MPSITTIFWRDIPAQVIAKQGRKRVRHELSHRFQVAIDRAAMRAKKINTDAYLDDWHRVSVNEAGDLDALVQARSEYLEAHFNDEYLERITKNKGLLPDPPPTDP